MEGKYIFNKLLPILQTITRNRMHATCGSITAIRMRNFSNDSNPPGSVYEPDYLDSLKPEYPQYPTLNIAIKSYDFPILESYQRYLHGVAEYLEIDVSDCYALPAQKTTVNRLRPNSVVVDAEYKLTMYERNIQMNDVDAPVYPVFLRIAQAALPEGVSLQIQEHTKECEERRYVPDRDLLDLKTELERMSSGLPPNKKK